MEVIVAMSGGVDSSVAAYLLKQQGYRVTGLSFELWDRRDTANSNTCCSVRTIGIAKSVAKKLGIEHYTVDVRDSFYRHVIEDFCTSYISGTTPNPCILCNKHIKFDFLLRKAAETGAGYIATGHYARTESAPGADMEERRSLLKKGIDERKDQSYVLYVMKQEELSRAIFPLGGMKKQETRRIARQLGLSTALRAESQEICFVGGDNYADFIKSFSPEALRPGPVVDTSGKVLGEHRGIAFYTIGQRKGLGTASLQPRYVTAIDRESNTVIVGSREDAMRSKFKVKELNWISMPPPAEPFRAHVRIRSTMREMPATVTPDNGAVVTVEYDEPQWAPAPGQSAVFYHGDVVIGGGIIEYVPPDA